MEEEEEEQEEEQSINGGGGASITIREGDRKGFWWTERGGRGGRGGRKVGGWTYPAAAFNTPQVRVLNTVHVKARKFISPPLMNDRESEGYREREFCSSKREFASVI